MVKTDEQNHPYNRQSVAPLMKPVSLLWFWFCDIQYKITLCVTSWKQSQLLYCRAHNRLMVIFRHPCTYQTDTHKINFSQSLNDMLRHNNMTIV